MNLKRRLASRLRTMEAVRRALVKQSARLEKCALADTVSARLRIDDAVDCVDVLLSRIRRGDW